MFNIQDVIKIHSKQNRQKSKHRASNGKKRPSRNKKRLWTLNILLIATLGVIAWRVLDIQQVYGKKLLQGALAAEGKNSIVLAPRGAILDSAGNNLAYDIPAYMLDIETSSFQDKSQLAEILSETVGGKSPSQILQFLQGNSKWVRWPSPVLEPNKEKLISALKSIDHEQSVTFTPSEERMNPYGTFAANVLGYVGPAGTGENGLEAEYNSVLAGKNGSIDYTDDGYGFPVPSTVKVIHQAQPGDNVETTIDSTIQAYVENEMNNLVSKYHPDHASIIVTNPYSGAILAMSSRPTYNPSQYGLASSEALNSNWGISSPFEPGSTFKPIVLAAGLATNKISLNTTFLSGQTTIDGSTINDWKPAGWGVLTYQQALEYSSNVGFAHMAESLGWPGLLQYMRDFGFLQPTGIDLPGEGTPLIFSPDNRGPVQLATSGFGQGIAVTPIQEVAAIGALANGGNLMKPYLMKSIVSPDGKVIKSTQPTVVRSNFIPQNVLDEVNQTMVLDVTKGIDSGAAIPGYDVAGKTGTAQIVNPANGQYYDDRFNVSFVGYAPADHPVVEIYVTVSYPKTPEANTWGSTIAVPTAKNIMEDCLQYYHVPPTGDARTLAQSKAASTSAPTKYVETPDIIGESLGQATRTLKQLKLVPSLLGNTGTVERQWPAAGIQVEAGSTLYGYIPGQNSKGIIMPNLAGLSKMETANILSTLDLKFVLIGNGFATTQSAPVGQHVAEGATVTVHFSTPAAAQ